MKRIYLSLVLVFLSLAVSAQQDTTYWRRGFNTSVAFSQLSLTNWSAGGQNSLSLNSGILLFADYAKQKLSWKNKIDLAYGFIYKKGDGYVKSDDKINVATEFGYLLSSTPNRWKWTTLFDFKTQFDKGYNYPNDSVKISNFMAPGYLTLVTGLEWAPKPWLTFLYSPLTGKITFVNDQTLANAGAYGVEPGVYDINGVLLMEGGNVNAEFGTFLRILFQKDFDKKVIVSSRAEFFTDYLKDFGVIDVSWESKLDLKVNSWLTTSLILHLIYDRDIRFEKTDATGAVIGTEPRVQFKEFLGIGFNYNLSNR